ncbi:MAG: S46 family peptidase [Bacteroidales bacterium]|nr:S46 family peptidase [Bacteroidales bacterium]
MKKILLISMLLFGAVAARADEGMWLPALISQRIDAMGQMGCRLSAEDIYSINQASLKDAVVLFGGGCTGELVSDRGLLLTNHHCGYSYIQRHSSVEHDYLKDGFWAGSPEEELPNPGLTVRFLDRMEDVTALMLRGYEPSMSEEQRDSVVEANSASLIRSIENPAEGIRASVEALYYANQYYLFVYRVFSDVRLVGAPPSSIGKFGGDTDNWMWPRHTGDFSVFRIYATPDGKPAAYSPSNVPYRPRKHFRISTAGVREGDFTFVYGCPGSTREYVHSEEVRYIGEVSDPQKIALRTLRLDIQKKYMSQSQAVRIQYSAKNASVANAWKKWQGESKGIARLGAVAAKQEYERRFEKWAEGSSYEGLLPRIKEIHQRREPSYLAYEYLNETVRSIEILRFASEVRNALERGRSTEGITAQFFKDYCQSIDEETFVALMEAFGKGVPAGLLPRCYTDKLARFGSLEAWKKYVFKKSVFTNPDKVKALGEKDLKRLGKDPALEMWDSFQAWFEQDLRPVIAQTGKELKSAMREYMRGQMEFEPSKAFYPDANLTLRVAYGKVSGYRPVDAVWYNPVSTLKGIIEKDNPDIFDYNIPQVLRDIYEAGGVEDQSVCFLATNHTSGGNSGSPVINADGDLIGINFDRVWEGTMSDLVFDPDYCRNISIDIRYLLFIIERVGGAGWLLEEMDFAPDGSGTVLAENQE